MSSENENNNINEILHNRAIQLAKLIKENELVDSSTILVFQIGDKQKYAVPYHPVQRVNRMDLIRSVPNLAPLFMGIIYINSEVWPVINGAELFNLSSIQSFEPEYLILMSRDDIKIALATNKVLGLEPFNKKKSLTQFETHDQLKTRLIDGVYESDIALINIESTFTYIKDYTP